MVTELGGPLIRLFVRPDGRPKRSDFVGVSLLVIFGAVFLASGLRQPYVPLTIVGSLMIAFWTFRLAICVAALRENGLRPTKRQLRIERSQPRPD
jgi:hypothetical protein